MSTTANKLMEHPGRTKKTVFSYLKSSIKTRLITRQWDKITLIEATCLTKIRQDWLVQVSNHSLKNHQTRKEFGRTKETCDRIQIWLHQCRDMITMMRTLFSFKVVLRRKVSKRKRSPSVSRRICRRLKITFKTTTTMWTRVINDAIIRSFICFTCFAQN